MMKALFYISKRIGGDDILYGLLELGIDAERSELEVDLDFIVEGQVEIVSKEVREYDFVISRNFSVNVAEGCFISNVPYISWCYDSPVLSLYRKEALYKTNHIFVFDKKHLERLKELGIINVYYQPLAANMIKASKVRITDRDIKQYDRDVSFIGSIYNKGYFETLVNGIQEECISECEDLFNRHLCRWDINDTVFDELSDRTVEALYGRLSQENRDLFAISDRFLTEYLVLVIELTSRERVITLNELSGKFRTIVHTHDPEANKNIISAEVRPPLRELSDELFRTYAASKVNINLTMRSIESGVPQRVFDIMSVGGCVFSNYQEEAEELFIPDKEIVLFKSLEELMDKASYYIKHERKRLEIGARGYLKVKDRYNYPTAVRNMIEKL